MLLLMFVFFMLQKVNSEGTSENLQKIMMEISPVSTNTYYSFNRMAESKGTKHSSDEFCSKNKLTAME